MVGGWGRWPLLWHWAMAGEQGGVGQYVLKRIRVILLCIRGTPSGVPQALFLEGALARA
jgi:hypothetical protein